MAELSDYTNPLRHARQEVIEAGVIALHYRRELDEQDGPTGAQLMSQRAINQLTAAPRHRRRWVLTDHQRTPNKPHRLPNQLTIDAPIDPVGYEQFAPNQYVLEAVERVSDHRSESKIPEQQRIIASFRTRSDRHQQSRPFSSLDFSRCLLSDASAVVRFGWIALATRAQPQNRRTNRRRKLTYCLWVAEQ